MMILLLAIYLTSELVCGRVVYRHTDERTASCDFCPFNTYYSQFDASKYRSSADIPTNIKTSTTQMIYSPRGHAPSISFSIFLFYKLSLSSHPSIFSVILSSNLIHLSRAVWTQHSTPPMPGGGLRCAISGVYENKAFFVGGQGKKDAVYNRKSTIVFDFDSNSYTTYPSPHLSPLVQAWGPEYTQQGNMLYFITPSPLTNYNTRYVSSYDMRSRRYTPNAIPYVPANRLYTDQAPCLVFYADLLFVLGGFAEHRISSVVDYFSIYDKAQRRWKTMGPSLPHKMSHFTCEIVGNSLYIVGGETKVGLSQHIYYLDVSTNAKLYTAPHWQTFAARLSEPRKAHSSVVVGTDIFVMGGIVTFWKPGVTSVRTKTVEIIHTAMNQISTSNPLSQAMSRFNLVFHNNMLYAFGGDANNGGISDKYQSSLTPAEEERIAREKAERERKERERKERERKERERIAREKAERVRIERARIAREKAERIAREIAEKKAREKAERERKERERIAKEKAERERKERERKERERKERERIAREKAERERKERERRERERKAEMDRAEQIEKEERKRREQERKRREQLEKEAMQRSIRQRQLEIENEKRIPIRYRSSRQWKLVLQLRNVKQSTFKPSVKGSGTEHQYNKQSNTYCILGTLNADTYKDPRDELYTFRLKYGYANGRSDTLIWKQASWPASSRDIEGFEAITMPKETAFKGLALSNRMETYLDGNGAGWWNSVGTIQTLKGGIPAYNGKIASSEALYVRTPKPIEKKQTKTEENAPQSAEDTAIARTFGWIRQITLSGRPKPTIPPPLQLHPRPLPIMPTYTQSAAEFQKKRDRDRIRRNMERNRRKTERNRLNMERNKRNRKQTETEKERNRRNEERNRRNMERNRRNRKRSETEEERNRRNKERNRRNMERNRRNTKQIETERERNRRNEERNGRNEERNGRNGYMKHFPQSGTRNATKERMKYLNNVQRRSGKGNERKYRKQWMKESGVCIACMKQEIIRAMRDRFGKNNERIMLLEKIDGLTHNQMDFELQQQLIEARRQQQKELESETNELEQIQLQWQKRKERERRKRMKERQRLLQKKYEMRLKEHLQLMNGLKGFLVAFRHLYKNHAPIASQRRLTTDEDLIYGNISYERMNNHAIAMNENAKQYRYVLSG